MEGEHLILQTPDLRPGMLVKESDPAGEARVFVVTKLLDDGRYCGHDVFSWDDQLAAAWTAELNNAELRYEVQDNKLWYLDGEKKTMVMTLFEVEGVRYCVGSTPQTLEGAAVEPYLPYAEMGNKIRRSMVFFDYNKSTWVLLPAE